MCRVGPASATRARSGRRATGVLSILLLAVGVGLTLAACGGQEELSRGEYERELQETASEVETAFRRVDSELRSVGAGSASLAAAADTVDALRDRLEEKAEQLDAMDPPDDAEAAHDQLVEGMNELVAELGDFRSAVENGDVERLHDFAERLDNLAALRKIDAATRELESQGYDVRG